MGISQTAREGRNEGDMAPAGTSCTKPGARNTAQPHDHVVQFYHDDEFLASTVGKFVADGLAASEPAIVIASAPHRKAFTSHLRKAGVDPRQARQAGDLTILDARELLTTFMCGTTPDANRFKSALGGVIEKTVRGRAESKVRAYGEMVDLLWKDGNADGALELEELWNDLASSYDLSLLCAYSMDNFVRAADGDRFRSVCDTHSRVVPAESYAPKDSDHQLIQISILQQRARALETEIAHREALEAELRDAVRMAELARTSAEQANRVKSEFLAVMSHELRTPLNAIGGYAELMELGVPGPITVQQRETLERIQRNQRHLLGLINQVLNYARIETGNLRYDISNVALDEMLDTTEALILPQLRSRGLKYRCDCCDRSIKVEADPEKLQQVLLNLVANAVKFTDRGGSIVIGVEEQDEIVQVRVRDTGIGIPAEKLPQIFDPFVQVDANYTRTRDGVGLGLAISRDLARGMGADLTVTSVEGEGSAFTLSLRRARET